MLCNCQIYHFPYLQVIFWRLFHLTSSEPFHLEYLKSIVLWLLDIPSDLTLICQYEHRIFWRDKEYLRELLHKVLRGLQYMLLLELILDLIRQNLAMLNLQIEDIAMREQLRVFLLLQDNAERPFQYFLLMLCDMLIVAIYLF